MISVKKVIILLERNFDFLEYAHPEDRSGFIRFTGNRERYIRPIVEQIGEEVGESWDQ